MADHDHRTAYQYHHYDRNSYDDARVKHEELDRGTLLAGAFLGAAILLFFVYMLLASPTA